MTTEKKMETRLKPWFAPSMLWAIADTLPKESSVMVEWGGGGSTFFWLRETEVSELYTIESNPEWHRKIEREIRDEERSRFGLHLCPFETESYHEYEAIADYTLAAFAPIERAHVILIDGHRRCRCAATTATLARPGAVMFLHDSESKRYQWIHKFMETHPDWAKCGQWSALPDDEVTGPLRNAEMTAWTRLG